MTELVDVKQTLTVVGMGGTLRERSRSRWALEIGLAAAESGGTSTKLLSLEELGLPIYIPGKPLADYPPQVKSFIDTVGSADAMLWSTGAYHGTMAGVTKNALDFLEFLSGEGYLDGVPVGMIATSGGQRASVNSIDAMVHTAHALRAQVLPLKIPIGKASQAFSSNGEVIDRAVERRLKMQAELLVEMANKMVGNPIPA